MIGTYALMLTTAEANVASQMNDAPSTAAGLFSTSLLLRQLAADLDECMARALEEAAQITGLLEATLQAMPAPQAETLAALIPAPPVRPDDYRLCRLQDYLDNLQEALIHAQIWLELQPDQQALLDRMWKLLHRKAHYEGRLVGHIW